MAPGARDAWRRRGRLSARLALAVSVAGTALLTTVVLGQTPGWLPWLRYAVLVAGLASAVGLLVLRDGSTGEVLERRPRRRPARGRVAGAAALAAGLGVVAVLAGPTAYALASLGQPHTGPTPAAGPNPTGIFGRPPLTASGRVAAPAPAPDPPPPPVVRLLTRGAHRYTWGAATVGSVAAARLQLAGDVPVMPVGGYYGTDPSPTLAQFRLDVARHRIPYFTDGRRPATHRATSAGRIRAWVHATFPSTTIGGQRFYDLGSG